MIFVTLGSQKFQFNRLLIEVDRLIEKKIIEDDVFGQIGASDYIPKNFKYKDFLTQEEFGNYMKKTDLVITHAGTGAIITALKNNKKVIAIPRLSAYGEHVDDHQIQLIDEFKELKFIEPVYRIEDLENAVKCVSKNDYNKYVSNSEKILKSIIEFIENDK